MHTIILGAVKHQTNIIGGDDKEQFREKDLGGVFKKLGTADFFFSLQTLLLLAVLIESIPLEWEMTLMKKKPLDFLYYCQSLLDSIWEVM